MRILVIGDFHGKFSKKFEKIIKRERIDIVVSNGDYLPFAYRELWFKHCFGKDVGLWEVIGKKKYKVFIRDDLNAGESVLKKMNNLPVSVVTVLGNMDYPDSEDVIDPEQIKNQCLREKWEFDLDRKDYFLNLIGKYKNVHLANYSHVKIGGYIFIGMRGHSSPGKPGSKAFRKHKRKLDKLFKRFRKENGEGKIIFVSHNVPYNTKLDRIGMKAHKSVRGEHYGSKMARRIIDQWQPILAVGGHIHEGRGKQMLGKTLCVNPGSAHMGEYAIVEVNHEKGNTKVVFKVNK